jgi:hypothetical protein
MNIQDVKNGDKVVVRGFLQGELVAEVEGNHEIWEGGFMKAWSLSCNIKYWPHKVVTIRVDEDIIFINVNLD